MKAVILAAGRGTRLATLTKHTPKCLLKVGQRTILEHMISTLNEYNIIDILLVIGTKGNCWDQESYEIINNICEKSGAKLILNFENDKTQSSYSLSLAIKGIEKTSLIAIDGDIFLSKQVLSSICNAPHDTFIVSKRTDDLSEPGTRIITDLNGQVTTLGKNSIPNMQLWFIYSGILKIDEKSLRQFKEILSKKKYKTSDISHPLKEFSQEHELYNLEVNEGWININTPQDLKDANELWRKLK